MGRPRIYKSDKDRSKAYRENNKEHIVNYYKDYYQKHRGNKNRQSREWNKNNYKSCLHSYKGWYARKTKNQACFTAGKLLLKGLSDKEIAKRLKVKVRTVKSYIKRLCIEFKVERGMNQRVRLAVKLYQYPIFRGE